MIWAYVSLAFLLLAGAGLLFEQWIKHKKPSKQIVVTKTPQIKVTLSKKTDKCSICLDRLTPDFVACKNCYMISHKECLREMTGGTCPGLGCRQRLVSVSA